VLYPNEGSMGVAGKGRRSWSYGGVGGAHGDREAENLFIKKTMPRKQVLRRDRKAIEVKELFAVLRVYQKR